jgi:DNA-binding NarL/FixJ family response regulator
MTPAPRRPSCESPAAPVRVLVVDDDPRVRAGLAGVLAATRGLAVAAATGSASRALVVAARGLADVALVDALLPTPADGVLLVRRLARHLPVVVISLDGTSRSEVLAAGAVAYLEKDGAVEGLVDAVLAAAAAGRTVGR